MLIIIFFTVVGTFQANKILFDIYKETLKEKNYMEIIFKRVIISIVIRKWTIQ